MKKVYSFFKFSTWFGILASVLVFTAIILNDGEGSQFWAQALTIIPIPMICMAIYQYRDATEQSAGFRKPSISEVKNIRGTMMDGFLGISVAVLLVIYGQPLTKLVEEGVILITSYLLVLLYKCYKECMRNV